MPATDQFDDNFTGLSGFISGVVAVTPHATNELAEVSLGIMCTGAGDVAIVFDNGSEATLALAADTPYPYRVRAVKVTGTTATGILALY